MKLIIGNVDGKKLVAIAENDMDLALVGIKLVGEKLNIDKEI